MLIEEDFLGDHDNSRTLECTDYRCICMYIYMMPVTLSVTVSTCTSAAHTERAELRGM